MTATTPAIERMYLESEYVKEGRNGRLYPGILGWRWIVQHAEAEPEGHKTLRAAKAEAAKLAAKAD